MLHLKLMKQLSLFNEIKVNHFGGSLLNGRRKTRRPFDSTKPIHLVLKATNPFVLLGHRHDVEMVLRKYAKKIGLQVYEVAVNADHIHLLIRGRRELYLRWIRSVTSMLVRKFVGLKWKFRRYTRIGAWGRGMAILKRYMGKNRAEANLTIWAEERVTEFRRRITGHFRRYCCHIGRQ